MRRHESNSSSELADWLVGTVRRHPEAFLVMAAGCALLLRGRKSAADTGEADEKFDGMDDDRGVVGAIRSGVSDVTEKAGAMVSDAYETAGSYASSVSNYASKRGRRIGRQASRLGRQAESAAGHVFHEQPIAVAAVGLAAGAALAALAPRTDLERRTLQPARDALAEAAMRTADSVKERVGDVGKKLQERATEGLKELAADTVRTVANGFAASSEQNFAGPATGKGVNGDRE